MTGCAWDGKSHSYDLATKKYGRVYRRWSKQGLQKTELAAQPKKKRPVLRTSFPKPPKASKSNKRRSQSCCRAKG